MGRADIATVAATMTSLELVAFINDDRKERAQAVGVSFPSYGFAKLEHADFMKKVHTVLGERAGNFSATYQIPGPNGSSRTAPGYRFPKREACLMAMSYSYELQAKVFDRMTALEQVMVQPAAIQVPQTLAQALRLAADQAEQIEAQKAAIALAAPKVEFVDLYVKSAGFFGFREVCKVLAVNEAEFRQFLLEREVMYLLGRKMTPRAEHMKAGRFVCKAGRARTNDHAFTQPKFTAKGLNWIAGMWGQHQAANRLHFEPETQSAMPMEHRA